MRKMTTYTLSIENMVRTGTEVTERAVNVAVNGSRLFGESYNPNAKQKKPFNSEDHEFDTSFSIVHPFRKVAKKIVHHYLANGDAGVFKLEYHGDVNNEQKTLFENIVAQEHKTVRAIERNFSLDQGLNE